MKKIFLTLFITISALVTLAQPSNKSTNSWLNTITTALPFMSITPDSRAGGMGDAGTSLSATAYSSYWNTSMISFAKDPAEIGVSYTPWLRQLTNDMNISYLSGYKRFSEKHSMVGALRYFSLGSITFTDAAGNVLRSFTPNEWEFTAGYAFKLNPKLSIGINGKYAYSNLTGGFTNGNVATKPATTGATDISFTYLNPDSKIGGTNGVYTFAATLNNIGNKVNYSTSTIQRDFIPMNIKIANSFKAEIDKYNDVLFALEFQKLLVPTPPITSSSIGYESLDSNIIGKDNNVGIISGIKQSFYDAPGRPIRDENGKLVQNADGTYQIEKNSRLKEELNEINICLGLEYWYNNAFAIRGGYFHESKTKGGRQYANIGLGLKYNKFGIDLSYLLAVNGKSSPLANTLRFSMRFTLGKNTQVADDTKQ